MAQLLLPVDPRLSDPLTVFWSPSTDDNLQAELSKLSAEVVGFAQDALAGSEADPKVCNVVIDYLRRIRMHAERAWFVTAAADMAGKSVLEIAKHAQAAVELRYWGELILDDVADRSGERCGAPTLHLQLGEMEAVYLGEVLFAAAQTELIRFIEGREPPRPLQFDMLHAWTQVHARVNSAQFSDLTLSHVPLEEVSPDDALNLIEGTTAVEVANCFYMGGIAGTFDPVAIDMLHRLGMIVGLLMQARDDCLDYIDDIDLLNKEPLQDFRNGRKKVAIVVGYHHADDQQREAINELLSKSNSLSASDVDQLRSLIFNPMARTYLSRLRERLFADAEKILSDARWNPVAAHRIRRFLDL